MVNTANLSQQTNSFSCNYCLQKVDKVIKHLTEELESIKDIRTGKPARYYYAYREYSLEFGIHELRSIYTQCTCAKQAVVALLIEEYISTRQSLTHKI